MLRRLPMMAAAALLPILAAAPSAAQDEPIELADDPFEITDPIAARPGEAELAAFGFYERARRGRTRDTVGTEIEAEFGVAPRLELRLGQAGAYGNLETRRRLDAAAPDRTPGVPGGGGGVGGEETGAAWGGATRLGLLYQLTEDDGGALPIVGVLGRVRVVYGPRRPAHEAEAVALIGKTVVVAGSPLGLHLNLGWVARLDPQPGERPGRYFFNASVGRAVTNDTALVVTYAREQQERGERDFDLLQAGVRHRLPGGRTVVGLAAGAGLTRDSPRFQLAFAVQWAFGTGGW